MFFLATSLLLNRCHFSQWWCRTDTSTASAAILHSYVADHSNCHKQHDHAQLTLLLHVCMYVHACAWVVSIL
jgi:hypothetical protein